jgi:hypothetical protein
VLTGGVLGVTLPALASQVGDTRIEDISYAVSGTEVSTVSFSLRPVPDQDVYAWFNAADWRSGVPFECTTDDGRTTCRSPGGAEPLTVRAAEHLYIGLGSPATAVLDTTLTPSGAAPSGTSAAAGVSNAPAEAQGTGTLPFTGAELGMLSAVAAAVIAAGALLLAAVRRRRGSADDQHAPEPVVS